VVVKEISDDENDILQAFRMPSISQFMMNFGGYAGTAAKRLLNNPRIQLAKVEMVKQI